MLLRWVRRRVCLLPAGWRLLSALQTQLACVLHCCGCVVLPDEGSQLHACFAAWLTAAVEAALVKVQGVQSASVSLTVQQAEVRHSGGSGLEQRLVEAVEGCGFEATGEGGGPGWPAVDVAAALLCSLLD
jgi:copper chaperone CopZ